MNLEDRLRSHMHATPDPELGPGPSAGTIAGAGRQRQRRRRVGSVVAGAVVAVGLVGGAAALLDDDSQGSTDFAATASTAESADSADSAEAPESAEAAVSEGSGAIAESDPIDENIGAEDAIAEALPQDGADEIASMPAFGGEQIVGVDDGFAGLRTNDIGDLFFITSADGEIWTESPTTGLFPDAFLSELAHHDGTFVALFERFDGTNSVSQLAVSTNGFDWELRELDAGEADDEDSFFSGLALGPSGILTVASVQPASIDLLDGVVVEESGSRRSVAVTGPPEGPFTLAPLEIELFGIESVAAGDSSLAIVAFIFDDRVLLTSTDGTDWVVEERIPTVVPATVAVVNGEVVSVVATSDQILIDGSPVTLTPAIPQVWSVQSATGESGTAVLVSGDDAEPLVDSDAFVAPEVVSVLLFSSDGESWVELGFAPSVSFENGASLLAVGDDEILVRVFGVDGSQNVRVPLG